MFCARTGRKGSLDALSQGSLQNPWNTPEHWNTNQRRLKLPRVKRADNETPKHDGTSSDCDERGRDNSAGAACHGMGCSTRSVPGGQTQMDAALALSAGGKAGRCLSAVGRSGATEVRAKSRRSRTLLRNRSNRRKDWAGARQLQVASDCFGNLPSAPDPGGRLRRREVFC